MSVQASHFFELINLLRMYTLHPQPQPRHLMHGDSVLSDPTSTKRTQEERPPELLQLLLLDSRNEIIKEQTPSENGKRTRIINKDLSCCITPPYRTQIEQKPIPVIVPRPRVRVFRKVNKLANMQNCQN